MDETVFCSHQHNIYSSQQIEFYCYPVKQSFYKFHTLLLEIFTKESKLGLFWHTSHTAAIDL